MESIDRYVVYPTTGVSSVSTASTKLWSSATTRFGWAGMTVSPIACFTVLNGALDDGVAAGSAEPQAASPATRTAPTRARNGLIRILP
ncbi:hypothetical protein GCM10022419_051000 [Nonomuraea rosea]|uniref:Uncharacterized protein n=1 Tax=Nonomuraea rosea TaxID=638574 RepID=A0ABP6XAF6_9ACTN